MIAELAVVAVTCFLGYAYLAIRAPQARKCGSHDGPPVSSPRVKLGDGRHLAYKERGVAKEEAKYKIIVIHGFGGSKDSNLHLSQELINEYGIYNLSFDRAGYGESDPNPTRSVKTDALDIQELADKLRLGPKFYVMGISMGAYPVYGCLKYIPHRLSGAALVVPFVNFWWEGFPPELANEAFGTLPRSDQWTFRVVRYAPWLSNWWMTQKWFTPLSIKQENLDYVGPSDQQIIRHLSQTPKEGQEKARHQDVHESMHRDMIVSFRDWGFDPTDLVNPFPNNEGSVHIWQGFQDYFIPYKLTRYLSRKLPWINYHEVADAGHMLMDNAANCEAIFKALLLHDT